MRIQSQDIEHQKPGIEHQKPGNEPPRPGGDPSQPQPELPRPARGQDRGKRQDNDRYGHVTDKPVRPAPR